LFACPGGLRNVKLRVAFVLYALSLVAVLGGCTSPPKLGPHEVRAFRREAALVDTAVLAADVIPGAEVKKYGKGDPVDYLGHAGRRIRVTQDRSKGATIVMVTHAGFGGPVGAQHVLNRIERWMAETDAVAPRPGAPPPPKPPAPPPK